MAEIKIPEREIVSIESLKVDGLNPNRMTARQIDALKEDIKKYGFIVDIITNKDGLIADGQNRWEAAKELGMTMVPIRRLPLTEVDRRILRQVLNKLHGSHDWDADINEYGFIKDEGRFEELKALLGGGRSTP